jgi:hypothetical protein
MAKAIDPKAQAKKQKKRAIIAAVLFVAVLAYQVPKTLKMLNPKPVSAGTTPAPATTTPAPVTGTVPTPGVTPTPGAPATGATTGTGADALVVNADLSPAPMDGQLVSLTRFSSKDPFAPQDKTTVQGAPPSSTPPTTSSPKPSTTPSAGNGGSFTPAPSSGSSGSSTPAPSLTVGTISLNKVAMAVTVKTDFPVASPMFTLVSLTSTAAKIAIAGGSLATGASTVTLPLGKTVTLMNTADGTRYELIYVGPGDLTPPASAAGAAPATSTTGTTTTTTPAPAAIAGR